MIVITIENASNKLRGELTKWILEARPGTFVGNVNSMVKDKLWNKVCEDTSHKGALLIYSTNNEQGFAMLMCGEPYRNVVDVNGIQLIRVKNSEIMPDT